MRRAKIVATLGPATGTPDRIAALIEGGANVIRVNASHGTAETRGRWIEVVRRAADGAGVPVAVLVDLQGPRIRVGELASSRCTNVVAAARDTPRDSAISFGRAPSPPPRSTAVRAAWARCDSPKARNARSPARWMAV